VRSQDSRIVAIQSLQECAPSNQLHLSRLLLPTAGVNSLLNQAQDPDLDTPSLEYYKLLQSSRLLAGARIDDIGQEPREIAGLDEGGEMGVSAEGTAQRERIVRES
jgi:hypothetical protein